MSCSYKEIFKRVGKSEEWLPSAVYVLIPQTRDYIMLHDQGSSADVIEAVGMGNILGWARWVQVITKVFLKGNQEARESKSEKEMWW